MPKIGETELKNPLEAPQEAQAQINKLLKEANSPGEKPTIEYPSSDLVHLPGGWVNEEGEVIRTARVRELTGEDEETMARAVASNNPVHFVNTIIECGTVSVGSEPPEKTRSILKDLLVGDKEQLFVGIRVATYGPEVHISEWSCPNCAEISDLTIHLAGPDRDIDIKTLDSPETELEFNVPLWKGGEARVRLFRGSDQEAVFKDTKWTQAQIDTKILSLCVVKLTDANGEEIAAAVTPQMARNLGLRDRKRILKELMNRQPGPQLNNIKFTCDMCGEEVSLAVGLEELFLRFQLLSDV